MNDNDQSEFEFETRTSFKRKTLKNNDFEETKTHKTANQIEHRT